MLLRQFSQYTVVGGIAFFVDFTLLYLLTEMFGLYYLFSATAAFTAGLVVNYLLCIVWIFNIRAVRQVSREFAIFSLIGLAGLAINNGLMYVLTEFAGLHYLISKFFSAAIVLIFNFTFRRSILFTERKKASRHAARRTTP